MTFHIGMTVVFEERRWRWSWLRMQWEPRTLSEDYVFVERGVLEGIEPWRPLTATIDATMWDDLVRRYYE